MEKSERASQLSGKLYIATVGENACEYIKKYGLGIELDQFCWAQNIEGEDYVRADEEIKGMLEETKAQPILHAPFNELFPAAIDPKALSLAYERYEQAYNLARQYGAKRMVVHSGYVPFVYFKEYHVERSVEFWDNFMKGKAEDFILLIENVLEDEPRMLREMMEKLEAKGHNLGVCLDIGHALCISDVDIIEWIRTIGKYIRHVHLHNNDGSGDRHDIFDCENCKADMQEVLDALKEYGAEDMTYTIESLNPKEAMRWLVEKGYVEE